MIVHVGDDLNVVGLAHRLTTSYGCQLGAASIGFPSLKYLMTSVSDDECEYCIVSATDSGKWSDQVAILIPLFGTMNRDLGANYCTGCATRYIDPRHREACLAKTEHLSLLTSMNYKGFVSWAFNANHELIWSTLGVPFLGTYSLLSSLSAESLLPFIEEPLSVRFVDAWAAALLVSRYPWPYLDRTEIETMVDLSGMTSKRYFWRFDKNSRRGNAYETNGTALGVVTGFSTWRLSQAIDYVMMGADSIDVKGKQYRTDLYDSSASRWGYLKEMYQWPMANHQSTGSKNLLPQSTPLQAEQP